MSLLTQIDKEIKAEAAKQVASLIRELKRELTSLLHATETLFQRYDQEERLASRKPKHSIGKRPRAVITDKTRAKVKELVKAGKTGGQIAKATGISLPSVQNIKKALGLVEARKK